MFPVVNPPSPLVAAAIIHVGGAEVRGEVAALAGEDAAAQLPACRTLGERSAQFTGCKPRHDTLVDAGGGEGGCAAKCVTP
jgi:hypothetical protein